MIFKNIKTLSIAGGEPFLFAKLPEFVSLVMKSMPKLERLSLITNGFLTDRITKMVKQISERLKDSGIELVVGVSLDGIGVTHDAMRGVSGAFKKVSATVKELQKGQKMGDYHLNVSGVVCGVNIREIKKVEKWCKDLDVPFFYQIVGFHDTYVNNLETKKILDIKKGDRALFLKIINRLIKSGLKGNLRSMIKNYYWSDMLSMYKNGTSRTSPCSFLKDAFVLDSLGDVYYCLSEKAIGNIRKGKSVSEIYYDLKNIKYRQQLPKTACLGCNSGCMVTLAIAKDFKKWAWFWLTRRTWPF